jgi:hypothetical protein
MNSEHPEHPLNKHLIGQESEQLRRYLGHMLAPEGDRPFILTAHAVVERLLGDMISSKLSHPDIWLNEADFRSRTNLARAFGLIGDREMNVCRVLNSARNCAAHGLEPLPDKGRVEIMRLGCRAEASGSEPKDLREALHNLVTRMAGPWLYARVGRAKVEILDQHRQRWIELAEERLSKLADPERVIADAAELQKFGLEISIALSAELRAKPGDQRV